MKSNRTRADPVPETKRWKRRVTSVPTRKSAGRGAGRPRSEKSHRAILRAALELLSRDGLSGMSIEGVAERAGVGKTTIYRRWATKEELVMAALQAIESRRPFQVTGDFHKDVLAWARSLLRLIENADIDYLDLIARIFGEARANPGLMDALIQKIYGPRMAFFSEVFKEAKKRGDIRRDIELTAFLSVIGGAFLYYGFISGTVFGSRRPKNLEEQMVDIVLHGIEPRPASR